MASKDHPAPAMLWGVHSSRPKLHEPESSQGRAGQGRGNVLKWEQETGSTSLSGKGNSLPLPQQPGAAGEGVGKGCDLLQSTSEQGSSIIL